MSTAELEQMLTRRRQQDDQELLRRLADVLGQGLGDLTSTRNTPVLVACRRVMVETLRGQHRWTVRRIATALRWPVLRVKRLSVRK